jgi:hypothetical protein
VERRDRRLQEAERALHAYIDTADVDEEPDEEQMLRLKKANHAHLRLIQALPPKTILLLTRHKKCGDLFTLMMQGVLGAKKYNRQIKKAKGKGGGFEEDEDDPDPGVQMR